ncbi:MAG: glycosyltransferase family 4 protein [Anaerolineales bacterium]
MRVAFITSQAVSRAGWGRYSVELITGARQLGIEPVLIMSPGPVDEALQDIERHAILPPVLEQRFATPRSLLAAPQLRGVLRTCDVAHCIVELYAPLVSLALGGLSTRFVLSVFGTWAIRPLESRAQRLFFAPAFRRADRILAISGFTRDWMARLMALPETEVLAGGVHPARFGAPVAAELPPQISEGPLVISVGAVKPRKGQDVAVEAIAHVREHIPKVQYAMAGRDDEMPEFTARLRERIAELGLEDNVHFLGQLPPYSTLVKLYQAADVFLLPSTNQGSSFEGLGFVFLEAAAAGTPAIGTHGCGAMEAIRAGETGILVPQHDPAATAAALLRLLRDDDLRGRMAAAGPAHAERLSWDNLAQRAVEVYKELVC